MYTLIFKIEALGCKGNHEVVVNIYEDMKCKVLVIIEQHCATVNKPDNHNCLL